MAPTETQTDSVSQQSPVSAQLIISKLYNENRNKAMKLALDLVANIQHIKAKHI